VIAGTHQDMLSTLKPLTISGHVSDGYADVAVPDVGSREFGSSLCLYQLERANFRLGPAPLFVIMKSFLPADHQLQC
jgi:hypothetical protein